MDARRAAVLLLAVVALSALAGWTAASRIRSPAEIAARTASPPASPILVPAESRVLSTDVVTRGTARFGSPQRLSIASSAQKPGAGVVGELPALGAELREGDIVLTASGRPVFLLVGQQPSFRDLGPGDEGADVRQLEDALARLGHDPGVADGVYDSRTEEAVAAWYGEAAFAPFTASAEQRATIGVLETELGAARLELLAARDAERAADAGLDAASATQAAGEAVASGALRALSDAVSEARAPTPQTRSPLPRSPCARRRCAPSLPARVGAPPRPPRPRRPGRTSRSRSRTSR